jgi:hypothetical protein
VGAGAQVIRDGPRAALSREAGARAVGTHDGLGAAPSRKVGAIVLTWSLYVGVPGPQGTDSGSRAHPGRGREPVGGANILSPGNLSESLCVGILIHGNP